jgi:hypothetical protein
MKTNSNRSRTGGEALFMAGLMILGAILMTGTAFAGSSNNPSFNKVQCTVTVAGENLGNTAIQSAITTASPGSTICITAGVYPEQLVINKPLTLVGMGYKIKPGVSTGLSGVAVLQPTSLVSTTTDVDSSTPYAPIILVQGTTGVTIENLQVNGSIMGSELTDCGDSSNPEPIGILYQSASGTIYDVQSFNVESPASLFGCQTDAGLGIEVQTAATLSSTVNISDTYVTAYQKNGITCNDANTSCNLNSDIVTGIGQTTLTAQNGVQIAYGATGSVEDTEVSGDSYTGPSYCPDENYFGSNCYQATGMLAYDAKNITISDSQASFSDIGIWVGGDGTLAGSYGVVNDDILSNNYGYGLVFDSYSGASKDNLYSNNSVGLLVTGCYADTWVTSQNDHFSKDDEINSEGINCGTGYYENLIVTANDHGFGFPFLQHLPHLMQGH